MPCRSAGLVANSLAAFCQACDAIISAAPGGDVGTAFMTAAVAADAGGGEPGLTAACWSGNCSSSAANSLACPFSADRRAALGSGACKPSRVRDSTASKALSMDREQGVDIVLLCRLNFGRR